MLGATGIGSMTLDQASKKDQSAYTCAFTITLSTYHEFLRWLIEWYDYKVKVIQSISFQCMCNIMNDEHRTIA